MFLSTSIRRPALRRALAVAGLLALTAGPIAPSIAGAAQARHQSPSASLVPKKTVNCGAETIVFDSGNNVVYNQIHATNVSCAVAKQVVRLGGRFHGKPPKGWAYVNGGVVKGNCAFTWRDAKELVTGYTSDSNGC
jgi:hypothetical protein